MIAVRCDFCDLLDLDGQDGAKCPECPKGLMWPAKSEITFEFEGGQDH